MRSDGQTWTTYTTDDGLAYYNNVQSIAVAPDGALWVVPSLYFVRGGVSRFDGQTWTTYTTDDGLAHNEVQSITVAPDGALWFDTRDGVSRFDGQTWTTYTTANGLAHNGVRSITVAPDGALWVGTNGGVSHFDGQNWTTHSTKDGLANNGVFSIAVSHAGTVWFEHRDGLGLSRYDGSQWVTYSSVEETIEANYAAILTTVSGGRGLWVVQPPNKVWLVGSPVKVYDDQTWTTYTEDDGLAGNSISPWPWPPTARCGSALPRASPASTARPGPPTPKATAWRIITSCPSPWPPTARCGSAPGAASPAIQRQINLRETCGRGDYEKVGYS